MSINAGGEFPVPQEMVEPIVELLTPKVLAEQRATFESLGVDALVNTLVPHRALPDYSVARYLIECNADGRHIFSQLNEAYDLGVVFARSLVLRALDQENKLHEGEPGYAKRDLPVITSFNEEGKRAVDTYLNKSKRRSANKLTSRLEGQDANISQTISWFAEYCQKKIPRLMRHDGQARVAHGFHDYLSAVTLLETPEQQRPEAMLQLLGRSGLRGLGNPA